MNTCTQIGPGAGAVIEGSGAVSTEELRALVKTAGAVLLRGAATTQEEFERITQLHASNFVVHHNRSRMSFNENDTTQSVTAGQGSLYLHRERSYAPGSPDLMFFFCVRPASADGETTLCDGVALYRALPTRLAEWLKSVRVTWNSRLQPAEWQRMCQTEDRTKALEVLHTAWSTGRSDEQASYTFDGDELVVGYTVPCVIETKFTREPAFANYLFMQGYDRLRATVEDGSPFPIDELIAVHAVAERLTVAVKWATHDLLVVDNTRFMHGRRRFDDVQRLILVRMGDARFE